MAQNTPAASLPALTDVWSPHVSFFFNLLPLFHHALLTSAPLPPQDCSPPGEPLHGPPSWLHPTRDAAALAWARRRGRLPARDAARTTSLSKSWAGILRSAPLVLIDAHLLPAHAAAARIPAVVSHALARHPDPFRRVHLTATPMATHWDELPRCLQLLAAQGAQDLVLVNRPTPIQAHLQLPGALLACAAFLTPEGEGGGEQAAGGGKPAQLASSCGIGKPARGRGGGQPG